MRPMMPTNLPTSHSWSKSTLAWLALLALAVLTYILGLGGQYALTNGDELVYTHIARLTAASGHWLPLVSDLDHMRNTKPPLLFWQAIVAGDWGRNWNMAALRLPSVIYTLLITLVVGSVVARISGDMSKGLMAACIYLAFLCTFRYGRTYLTSAPESFWLNVPMFFLLWRQLRSSRPHSAQAGPTSAPSESVKSDARTLGWLTHVGLGLAMGIGLA
ncbi:MAG: hypothetical protein RLZZ371_2357 [Pseudomonadota bacterium]